MVELKHTRVGRFIHSADSNVTTEFESINKAKKESIKLQMANGGMGQGSLIAIKKLKQGRS